MNIYVVVYHLIGTLALFGLVIITIHEFNQRTPMLISEQKQPYGLHVPIRRSRLPRFFMILTLLIEAICYIGGNVMGQSLLTQHRTFAVTGVICLGIAVVLAVWSLFINKFWVGIPSYLFLLSYVLGLLIQVHSII